MSEAESSNDFTGRIRHYAEILNDLFDPTPFMSADRLFEFVCALVRCGGLQGPGWDPWYESQAVISDLQNLKGLQLPPDQFTDPDRIRMRWGLLSYCHLTEMDLPYVILANLLRLRLGQKYDMNPLAVLEKAMGKSIGFLQRTKPPSPLQKIKLISDLAEKAKMPRIGEALIEIYDRVIRNAVYHSDYVLHNRNMHLVREHRFSKKKPHGTQVVGFDELDELFTNAFAFYTALFSLYERCRCSFSDFKNAFVPYDIFYKALMEFVFDGEDRLIGFRMYWPNGSYSECSRTKEGSMALNIRFNADGSINFMVGLYAKKPGSFSPLVEHYAQPQYPPRPGTEFRPYWPKELAVYKLPGETTA